MSNYGRIQVGGPLTQAWQTARRYASSLDTLSASVRTSDRTGADPLGLAAGAMCAVSRQPLLSGLQTSTRGTPTASDLSRTACDEKIYRAEGHGYSLGIRWVLAGYSVGTRWVLSGVVLVRPKHAHHSSSSGATNSNSALKPSSSCAYLCASGRCTVRLIGNVRAHCPFVRPTDPRAAVAHAAAVTVRRR